MSETLATQIKTAYQRYESAELQMIAQVEKWMTMIRELNRECETETKADA